MKPRYAKPTAPWWACWTKSNWAKAPANPLQKRLKNPLPDHLRGELILPIVTVPRLPLPKLESTRQERLFRKPWRQPELNSGRKIEIVSSTQTNFIQELQKLLVRVAILLDVNREMAHTELISLGLRPPLELLDHPVRLARILIGEAQIEMFRRTFSKVPLLPRQRLGRR